MIFFFIAIAYFVFLFFLIRFFRAVHLWDEEISSIMASEECSLPKAA